MCGGAGEDVEMLRWLWLWEGLGHSRVALVRRLSRREMSQKLH